MSDSGYGSLLSKGLRAPDDVWEVRDAEGRVARIERDPSYPGAKRVYLDPASSVPLVQAYWSLPASTSRPDFYPADLPFIPGISCRVLEGEEHLSAAWRDDHAPRHVDPEKVEAMQRSAPEGVSEFLSSMKESFAKGGAAGFDREAFKAFRDQLIQDDGLRWMASVGREDELEDRLVDGFQDTLRQSAEEGWVEEPAQEVAPFLVKSASLRKGDRRRTLSLMAPFGLPALMLHEKRAGPRDSA